MRLRGSSQTTKVGTPCSSIILETPGSSSAPEPKAATSRHSPHAEVGSDVGVASQHPPLLFPGHSPPPSTCTTSQGTKRDSHGPWNSTASGSPVFSTPPVTFIPLQTCSGISTQEAQLQIHQQQPIGYQDSYVSQNWSLRCTSDPSLSYPCSLTIASRVTY